MSHGSYLRGCAGTVNDGSMTSAKRLGKYLFELWDGGRVRLLSVFTRGFHRYRRSHTIRWVPIVVRQYEHFVSSSSNCNVQLIRERGSQESQVTRKASVYYHFHRRFITADRQRMTFPGLRGAEQILILWSLLPSLHSRSSRMQIQLRLKLHVKSIVSDRD